MVPELRPRGIGEMLDAAVALYRARFGRLVRITLAVIVPVQILNTIILLSAQPDSFRPNLTGGVTASYDDAGSASLHLAATLLVLMLTVISTAFIAAVCTRIVLTLINELRRRGGGVGAAALCGGGGQGDAAIIRTL